MKWFLLFTLILFVSCAHEEVQRAPSSEAENIFYGDADPAKSIVKMFSSQMYFVEIKDANSRHVDRDMHEFEIREGSKKIGMKVKRVLRGRYYFILNEAENHSVKNLDFYVANVKLKFSFRTGLKPAHVAHTKMKVLRQTKSTVKIELVLKDENGRPVETPEAPEIIPDAEVQIEKLEHMGNGNWQVTLKYPGGNQLFYISVRSQGVYFKNLFRFQYVETDGRTQ